MAKQLRSEQPKHNTGLLQPPQDPHRGPKRASSGVIRSSDSLRGLHLVLCVVVSELNVVP